MKKKINNKKVSEDKVLFSTKTIIDKEEFKKYHNFYLNKFKNNLIPKLIVIFLVLYLVIINLLREDYFIVIVIFILSLLYIILLKITLNIQIKNRYENSKMINMLEEELSFFDEYFISKSNINNVRVKYIDIFRVCETKTNFYIFVNDRCSFVLIKDNIEDIDSFREFIKDKACYKRYK